VKDVDKYRANRIVFDSDSDAEAGDDDVDAKTQVASADKQVCM